MLSKLIKPILGLSGLRCGSSMSLLTARAVTPGCPRANPPVRTIWGIPPSQYDTALPKKLQFCYVINKYWELIPVFAVTIFSIALLVLSVIWAIRNKVDVVSSSHNRDNISRKMDLRNPTVHKLVTINQKYKPWPEMQMVFEKMVAAEKREYMRAMACTYP